MVNVKRFVAVLMFTLGGLWFFASPASATTVLGTGAVTKDADGFVDNAFWQGFQFTTGSSALTLQSIDFAVANPGSTTMTWYLYADAGSGVPANGATAIASYTVASANYLGYVDGNAGTLSPIVFGGTLANYQLAPNTSYVLILQMQSALNVGLSNTAPSSTQGWSVSTQRVLTSDSGNTWLGLSQSGSLNFIFNLSAVPYSLPSAVPTLSEWSQMLLAFLLMSAMVYYGRRQLNH